MSNTRYTIDSQRQLIHVRCTGTVTVKEILEYEQQIVADPDFDPQFKELFDTTDATLKLISFGDVENLVEFESSHQRYVGSRKCAFVAPADLNFGIAKMYIAMEDTSPMETRVFRHLNAALEWLGLTPTA